MAAPATIFQVRDYDLAATLGGGQAFRWEHRRDALCHWERRGEIWTGVVRGRWVELIPTAGKISARCATPQEDWDWLADYLQVNTDLAAIVATFPDDAPLRAAVARCRGLRLLRQEPWECFASFILSSTKQIVQIRQIIQQLSERYGCKVFAPAETPAAFAFPTPEQIAGLDELKLRECKMGFRAPHLLNAARRIAAGDLNLTTLGQLQLPQARERLLQLPGVGPKIADCVLLFAYGFPTAFPVDVWVMKALRQFYFRNRRVPLAQLREFSATHFGPHGGYAQQYLFHSLRLAAGKKLSP